MVAVEAVKEVSAEGVKTWAQGGTWPCDCRIYYEALLHFIFLQCASFFCGVRCRTAAGFT